VYNRRTHSDCNDYSLKAWEVPVVTGRQVMLLSGSDGHYIRSSWAWNACIMLYTKSFSPVIRKSKQPSQSEGIDSSLLVVWALLTKFWYIFTQNITLGNYDEVITDVSGAVRGTACNVQEQTTVNLAIVTDIFARSATLVTNDTVIITNETVIITNDTIIITEAVSSLPFCLSLRVWY